MSLALFDFLCINLHPLIIAKIITSIYQDREANDGRKERGYGRRARDGGGSRRDCPRGRVSNNYTLV